MRLEANMRTKGSKNKKGVARILNKWGYYEVFDPTHPLAKKNGYIREHRKVAYDTGMLIDPVMEVHHKNGVKNDNRLENLEVVPKKIHSSITWKGIKRGSWSKERCEAKSKQMIGNQNWAGKEIIGNIYENPELLSA